MSHPRKTPCALWRATLPALACLAIGASTSPSALGASPPAGGPGGAGTGAEVVSGVVGSQIGLAVGADGSTTASGTERFTVSRAYDGGVLIVTIVPR